MNDFLDVRTPSVSRDLEAAPQIWQADPKSVIVFWAACSDYSCSEVGQGLGKTNRFQNGKRLLTGGGMDS